MKMPKPGLLVVGLLVTVQSYSADQRVEMKDLPAAVQKTVLEQSKGATIRGLSKEVENGKTYYEVETTVNGHGRDVLMEPSGAIVEIEEEIALASLPAAARAGLERSAGKGKILKVESVTKGNAIVAYEAQVEKAGKKSEITVRPDGKPVADNQ